MFRHSWLVVVSAICCSMAPSALVGQSPPPSNHHGLRRVAAITVGVIAGGAAGFLVGRRLARPALCDGCTTSANHDGYIGGGLAIGAIAGGTVAWYLTKPRHAAAVRVRPASYLTGAAPAKRSKEVRGLRPRIQLDSLAGELER